MDFPKKGEETDHKGIIYLKKTEIFMNQKPAKSPRSFENNLPVLLRILQMQWQRLVCVIGKDSANGFKNCQMKVEYCSLI